jgi:drug/metabolite transporter (DMT)-like permease
MRSSLDSTGTELTNCSPTRKHAVRGYLFIAAAALCWGVSATLGRAAFTGRLLEGRPLSPIEPLILAQSRVTISALLLIPLLLMTRGTRIFRMAWRDIALCLFVGVAGMAASNYFYYLSIQITNVATAIILQYTAPIWVLLYMIARRAQRATVQRIASVFLAVFGCALAIGVFSGQMKISALGVIAAQIAAVSFAFYNVAGARLVRQYERWTVLVYVLAGAALFWQFVNPAWKVAGAHYSSAQWLFMLVFAVTSILLPFSAYLGGLHHLDATRAIVTSCLEPVFSVVIAAIWLGEALGPLRVLGMAVVLGATVLVQMPDRETAGSAAVAVEPIE